MTHAAITGWGKCLPPAVLSNHDLSSLLDTSDEWIVSRTGIHERRISHVGLEELAYVAAARALAAAAIPGSSIELIVFGTCSHEDQVPNMASGIQVRIGAQAAAAFDINTACTSFLYGLSAAIRGYGLPARCAMLASVGERLASAVLPFERNESLPARSS